jgi:hypothetical protein
MNSDELQERIVALARKDGKTIDADGMVVDCTAAELLEYAGRAQAAPPVSKEEAAAVVRSVLDRGNELIAEGVSREEAAKAAIAERRATHPPATAEVYDPAEDRGVRPGRLAMVKSQLVHAKALEIANARGQLIDDLDEDRLRALYVEADEDLGGIAGYATRAA